MDLAERYNLIVIVASVVEGCRRPTALKKFLYLDFVDKVKYHKVWNVLQDNISKLGMDSIGDWRDCYVGLPL